MPGNPRSIDHVVWVVPDLTTLGFDMERLGFQIMPVMVHERIGTSNRIIQLHDSYLEFIADAEKAPPFLADRVLQRLRWQRGLAMVSLTSSDLKEDHAALLASGVETNPILDASRAVTMPDGSQDATRSSSFYTWNPQGDSLSLFRSWHGRPETIWIPEYQKHPNGVRTLCGLVYAATDPAASTAYFERLFEAPAQSSGEALRLTTPRGETVEVISKQAAALRYGVFSIDLDPADPGCCVAIRFSIEDITRVRALLTDKGVSFSQQGDELVVAPERTAGVTFTFQV